MNRRDFGALLGVAAIAWPLRSLAQQPSKIPRIGILLGPAASGSISPKAIRTGLRDLGWVEGQNFIIEAANAETVEGLPEKAEELVRNKVDLIFAASSTQVGPARRATKTIPIVFAVHADPVGVGDVASLARPGGNVTGVSMLLTDLTAKELEMLKETFPHFTRIGVLWNPSTPSHAPAVKVVTLAAEKLKVQLTLVPAQNVQEFETALSVMDKAHVQALLAIPSPLVTNERVQLAATVQKHRLPAIYGLAANVDAGGLMSYGANFLVLHRRAAAYIVKILKGANPADLPVEQPQEFELVINMKTAKSLGITFPPSILLRADRVVE